MNTLHLVHSSFLLLVAPFVYLLIKSPTTPWQETVMFHFYLTNFMLSVLFWSTITIETLYGWIHRIDAFLAKISSCLTIFYVLLYKSYYKKMVFSVFTFLLFLFFYLSHISSRQQWGSYNHLYYHRCLHIAGSIGICFVFL
jgi:hypothetical protein